MNNIAPERHGSVPTSALRESARAMNIPLLAWALLAPTAAIGQLELRIERDADDLVVSWSGGGVLQKSSALTAWETVLNASSPLRGAPAEQLDRQFFRD